MASFGKGLLKSFDHFVSRARPSITEPKSESLIRYMFHGYFLLVGGLHSILLRVSFDEEAFLILRKANFSVFPFLKKIYSFLAALGLYWFAQASSTCGERGLLFTAERGLQC